MKRKVIPPLKRGSLGVNFAWTTKRRRQQELQLTKRIGERKVGSKLQALAVLNKKRNPRLARKAMADRHYLAGSFKGKRRVNYPTDFA